MTREGLNEILKTTGAGAAILIGFFLMFYMFPYFIGFLLVMVMFIFISVIVGSFAIDLKNEFKRK